MSENEFPAIDLIRSEIEKCVGCGNCLYYCPVFAEEGKELRVARGRNRALKCFIGAQTDWTAEMQQCLGKCLLCGRCTMVCPQGVRNDLIVMAGREELARAKGLPVAKAIAFRSVLKNKQTLKQVVKAVKAVQRLLPRTAPTGGRIQHMPLEKGVQIRHLPVCLVGRSRVRHLPAPAGEDLSEQMGEHHPPAVFSKKRNLKVAYFAGCAAEFLTPSSGRALIGLLTQLGVEVLFPHDQGCCGIAAYANGDKQTAVQMAARNLEVFAKLQADLVVTGCATCGSALKEGWIQIVRRRSEKRRLEELAAKVRDISELLVELAEYQPLRYRSVLPPGTRVTYHDPCHLARYQRVTEQPRAILKQVFGPNYIEMSTNGCCGCGGSFSLSHYGLSKNIAADKLDALARSGADVVINTCPGCMVQLIDGIERSGLKQKVVHLVEAIAPLEEL